MESNTSKEALATTIAEHRLVKDPAPRYLALWADVAMFKESAADEVIFHEGDPANRFYLIPGRTTPPLVTATPLDWVTGCEESHRTSTTFAALKTQSTLHQKERTNFGRKRNSRGRAHRARAACTR